MKKLEVVKGSPEFDATVGEHPMFVYYVAGCCALRAFYGLDGKDTFDYGRTNAKIVRQPTPAQAIEGIVRSGCGGSTMVFTDAYRDGKALEGFKKFVESNKLGTFTISEGQLNAYTSRVIYAGIFEYTMPALMAWCAKNVPDMKDCANVPKGWYSARDRVSMDKVFYQYGGRPQNSGTNIVEEVIDDGV